MSSSTCLSARAVRGCVDNEGKALSSCKRARRLQHSAALRRWKLSGPARAPGVLRLWILPQRKAQREHAAARSSPVATHRSDASPCTLLAVLASGVRAMMLSRVCRGLGKVGKATPR